MKPENGCAVSRDGDIAAVCLPDGAFLLALFNGSGREVAWGDVVMDSPPDQTFLIPKAYLFPSAGRLIGKRFESAEKLSAAIQPHKVPGKWRK